MSPNILQHGRVLTVRTLTDSGGESNDSLPIDIDDILKKVNEGVLFLKDFIFVFFRVPI